MILFAFGCTKVDLQPLENIDSQEDFTFYQLNLISGSNGWVA